MGQRRSLFTLVVAAALALGLVQPAGADPNIPANDKIRMFVGQDSDTLSDYKRDVLTGGVPQPGGVTLYTNLVLGGNPGPLAGMNGPVNWGSGTVDFARTLNEYPGASLAVGLYLSDASAGCGNQPLRAIIGRNDPDVVQGNLVAQYRAKVDEMVTKLKSYNREIFLRIGYEYDGPWNCYNADFYKQAFRYIKGRINALGANRIATVWQSAAWPLDEHTGNPEWNYVVTAPNHFDVWYPGDDVVDWVGMSAFYGSTYNRYQWSCKAPSTSPRALQDRILNFARGHGKKVMIAEAAPQGFTTGSKTQSCIFSKNPQPVSGQTIVDTWFNDLFSYVTANRDTIRAVAYINTNWDSQTQWQCNGAPAGQPGCSNGYWGDSRVQADPTVKARWIDEIRKSQYVNGSGTTPPPPPPPSGRKLLVGQSNTAAWQDLTGATGADPAGGSVYYGVRDGGFAGQSGSSSHLAYADFLAARGKQIQVGISWKDYPPAWNGDPNTQLQASRQATVDIANGRYDNQFTALTNYINAHRGSTFLLRLDYEVSSAFHCVNGSDCSSYRNAFRKLVQLIDARTGGANVKYVYHPVRGEFDKLYPGDDVVDQVGLSIFNQDLCQPFWENGTAYWNGEQNTANRTCLGYYDAIVNGNRNAIRHEYPVDLNVLRMLWWSKQHNKKIVLSEVGVQRMNASLDGSGRQSDADYRTFVDRLGTLLNYRGPIPNGVVDGRQTDFLGTGYDLSDVIDSVVFINLDWRYGFDGKVGANPPFGFPSTSGWFVNSLVSQNPQGRAALCGLLSASFSTRCA
ncbi:hypothetical protein ACFWN2_01370 [Lentzea sp. NPDC058436]|uniref:hypothetical protein n=1 Tax=Lentzea sp. NPDC058436 TaxID=3346499 RepID=UPI0036681371